MNLNNRGFTLIEVLVAIVILTVGLLGLLQTVTFALRSNLENNLRQEAILVADEQMAVLKAKPFDLISTTAGIKYPVQRRIYSSFVNYSVIRNTAMLGAAGTTKTVDIEVRWKLRGTPYNHIISSLMSNRL